MFKRYDASLARLSVELSEVSVGSVRAHCSRGMVLSPQEFV